MTARKSDKSDTKEKALTAKQSRFVELVVMGASPSDAYRGAFDTKGKPETVAVEAWRLLHRNPKIAQMVEDAKREAMSDAITTRSTLLERMEQVNRRAFDKLTAEDAERIDGAALNAFMKTYEVLVRHCPADDFYSIAGAELTAQCSGDWTKAVFADDHVWFSDGGKELPEPEQWDSETVEPLPDGGVRITKKRIR